MQLNEIDTLEESLVMSELSPALPPQQEGTQ